MSLEDGLNLSRWQDCLFDRDNPDSVSLLFRTMWACDQFDAEGILWRLDEAGRPRGVEIPDFGAGLANNVTATASGISTMWYQWGQAEADPPYTPSAVDPRTGTSDHTLGKADDIWTNNRARQHQIFRRVGMWQTVPSEQWHEAIRENPDPSIDFTPYADRVRAVFSDQPDPQSTPTITITRRRR